jgi:hypothetical protein
MAGVKGKKKVTESSETQFLTSSPGGSNTDQSSASYFIPEQFIFTVQQS